MAEFNRYRVYFYSAPKYDWNVRIDLDQTGTPRATLLFMKPGRALPVNTSHNGVILLHYAMADYPAMMDLLRNEQPLYVTLNAATGAGAVSSSDEPVGEQEGR